MKLSHIAQVLTLALLIITSYLAWQARDESIKAGTKVDLQTRQFREIVAQAAAQQASPNLVPGLVTPLSAPSGASPSLPLLPSASPAASVTVPAPTPAPAMTTAPAGSAPSVPAAPVEAPLTPLQRRVKDAPSIGTVKEYVAEQGFVTLAAGKKNGIKEGMKFDLRRDASVVGRVTISIAEDSEAVADLDPKSVPAGVTVKTGDEIIAVVLAQ
jgi:hypothetical protein